MSVNSGSDCQLNGTRTRTKVEVHTVNHTWTIDNFDFIEAEGGEVKSCKFSAATNDNIAWFLELEPNGIDDAKDEISIHLWLSPDSKVEKVFAVFTLCALTAKGEKVSLREIEISRFDKKKAQNWGWDDFLTKDRFFRDNLLCNNTLTVHCEVKFSTVRNVLINTYDEMSLTSNIDECNLSDNFASLLETQAFSDVVLSTKGKDFPAHKLILAARSKVFAAMFKHDTKENRRNRVVIKDMSEEVVSQMLRFIYTGKCEKLDESAQGLLTAADKYDLNGLKKICSKALYKNLSVENAAGVLVSADLHNVTELKTKVIEFVAMFPQVLDTADWKNVIVNPKLINEVCRAMAHR